MNKHIICDLTNERTSGILMHLSSLPGPAGIGTMGKNAYRFVDLLKKANQRYWQILPICPTSFGDSPYQSFSSFAGNPYFIDLEILCEEGYLLPEEYKSIDWGSDQTKINYGLIYKKRHEVFEKVQNHFKDNVPSDYKLFCAENADWLDDYALFMAIKDAHGGIKISLWEEDIRLRRKEPLNRWKIKCQNRIEYYKMLQFLFYRQWNKLKNYANEKGVCIIGDIPIYISSDSVDVWTNPQEFKLNQNLFSEEVSGCPPDAFSPTGQLWGNPIYDWQYMKKNNYSWWVKRLRKSLEIYDVLRIDHFLGFDAYYCIPADSETAENGQWRKGPAMDFWKSIESQLGKLPIIAEDLGLLSDSVRKMLKESGFPGMKVLQFAFDSREKSDYLPYKYDHNCVVYTGTHDNNTLLGWIDEAKTDDVAFAMNYLRIDKLSDLPKEMMLLALSSPANTCILTMQDLMGLGKEARMNVPSTVGGNWCWRATKEQMSKIDIDKLSYYTRLYGRDLNYRQTKNTAE